MFFGYKIVVFKIEVFFRNGTERPQMFINSCHNFDVEPMTSTQRCPRSAESQDNVSVIMESQGMDGKSLPGIYWKKVTEVEADSEDPVTPVHVWPDTDEEWNDDYLNDLSSLKCQTPFNLANVLSVGQASLPCFNVHLAPVMPSSSPPQGTRLSEVSHPISKDSITPMSQSTCTTASATPSLDSESEDEKPEKPAKHEKLGDLSKPIFPRSNGPQGSLVDHPNESPLKQAIRTGALALKKARALMPAVNLEPEMKPMPMKVKSSRKAPSVCQVQVLPTGQVYRWRWLGC